MQVGVRRIEDPQHPREYCELWSPAEMRKLLNGKIVEQDRIFAICHFELRDYNDVVPDHENPNGMEGAWRDDHLRNDETVRQAVHPNSGNRLRFLKAREPPDVPGIG